MISHAIDIRVYYEDTDAGGIVYHANHLKYAERGRTEFLRHHGFSNTGVHREFGLIFVVRNIEIDYIKTAHLDDSLCLKTFITEMKNSSFIMSQRLYKNDDLISDMRVVLVCVNATDYKPCRLPRAIKDVLSV